MREYRRILAVIIVCIVIFATPITTLLVHASTYNYTVEGDMTRFATGNAYPTQIVFTGYNAITSSLYLNIGFEGGTTYNYTANVYQGSTGALWGSVSDTGISNTVAPILEVTNHLIEANVSGTDLEISHRIVVTVTSYTP